MGRLLTDWAPRVPAASRRLETLTLEPTPGGGRNAQRVDDGLRSHPGWFGPPGGQLFGWLHLPSSGIVKGGIVICPPVMFEHFVAHATLRRLADELARSGFAALRFDYRGTGDSTGDPGDLGDVEGWVDDIATAVGFLRAAGVSWTGAVGMRLGANLLATASARCDLDACVLWDPAASGRSFVRSATLLQRLNLASGGKPQPTESGSAAPDALGYDYAPAFVRSLSTLDLAVLSPLARTLLVTRDATPPSALRDREDVELALAVGQAELMDRPLHTSQLPEVAVSEVVAWLDQTAGDEAPDRIVAAGLAEDCEMTRSDGLVIRERTVQLGDIGLFGILSEPASTTTDHESSAAKPLTSLFLNSGLQFHIGPQRLWVEISRRVAASGANAIRFDFSGIGDSPTRAPYGRGMMFSNGALDDMDSILAEFADRPVALVGLSSGAYHVLEAAASYPVRGVVSIHTAVPLLGSKCEHAQEDPRRKILVGLRPWLRWVSKYKLTVTALPHVPTIVWRLLNALHLQADIRCGFLRAADQGSTAVMIVEESQLRRSWSWALRRRRGPENLMVIPSPADHSLFDPRDRRQIADLTCEYLQQWATSPSPALIPPR